MILSIRICLQLSRIKYNSCSVNKETKFRYSRVPGYLQKLYISSMKIVKLILQILLALIFILAGGTKAFVAYDEIRVMDGMAWVGAFSPTQILLIGYFELISALALLIPLIAKKLTFLVPLSSLGLVVTMIVAMITHIGRDEPFLINIVLGLLALSVFLLSRSNLKRRS